jgi:AcrR family transcriptional regulator
MEELVNAQRGNSPRRARQVARTERRIIEAATRLFLAQGYLDTTLTEVADAADVGTRTIYIRFGSKAALFKRVVDVAVVGDTALVDVIGRDWMDAALTASTCEERIAAVARIGRGIVGRAGALFAVAQQVAAIEPTIANYLQRGRTETHNFQRIVWTRMRDDGLLGPSCDLEWIVDTASVICAGETHQLIVRMLGWDLEVYQEWLHQTLARLVDRGPDPDGVTTQSVSRGGR